MRRLSFTGVFEALLCLDGTLPEAAIFRRCGNLPLIATDGAAIRLFRRYGIRPTFIVGDLDAFLIAPERELLAGVPLVQVTEQESTDFEKALDFIHSRDWRRVLVLGFQGEEPDHTLINWSIATRYISKLELCFYDAGRYGIPLAESALLELDVGETVSLVPQPAAVVKTSGFVWELQDEELRWGVRESARNLVHRTPVWLHLQSGVLALFCRARLPYAPVFRPAPSVPGG
jgi:thiamine pyrophosphokinase